MNSEKILRKVAHLRTLAARAGTPEEANSAAAQADAILQKYRLEEAQISQEETPTVADPLHVFNGSWIIWKRVLGYRLAQHYDCFAWYQTQGATKRLMICGKASNIELTRYMFAWAATEIERLSAAFRGKGERNSFKLGAVDGLYWALKESKVKATTVYSAEHGNSAAMVLVKDLEHAEETAKSATGQPFKNARTTSASSASSYARGVRAGSQLSAGPTLTSKRLSLGA